jgi:hypothetical protein
VIVLRAEMVDAQEVEERRAFVLGFAEDDEDGFELYLERVGERHRIVTGTEAEHEGGVESWQLAEGWLKLTLTRDAAVALALDVLIVIQFPPADTGLVRAALGRILAPARPTLGSS